MKILLQRALHALFGRSADEPAPPTAARAASTAASSASPSPSALTSQTLWSVGVRRPLISAAGEVVGFEFCLAAPILARHRRRVEPKAREAYLTLLLTAARLNAQQGRIGLARLPASWLAHWPAVEGCERLWIALEADAVEFDDPLLPPGLARNAAALRAAGVRIGTSPALWPDDAFVPDFLLLRQGGVAMDKLIELAKVATAGASPRPIVLTDIEGRDDFDLALAAGMDYLCGALGSGRARRDDAPDARALPPEVGRIGVLLSHIVAGVETEDLVSEIKGDVSLSYHLLRRLTNASYAQHGAGASIEKAVLMLGRKELYRWLSMLLVQYGHKQGVAPALQELALWRARLFELLALQAGEPDPGQLFTLGLASMLGGILGVSDDEVSAILQLSDTAREALLRQGGPWRLYLDIAVWLAARDAQPLPAQAERIGDAQALQELAGQAWAWAAGHADRSQPV